MRWQTEKEVESGKGQFVCGHKTCSESKQLRTWEVPFQYEEQGEKRTELVKLRLCPSCSKKLNFKHKRREVTRSRKKVGKRKRGVDDESSESEVDQPASVKQRTEEEETVVKEKAEEEEKKKQKEVEAEAASIWGGPAPIPEEEARTREDEFQAYLEDLFF
jgi:protein FRA10AC1